MGAAGLGHHLGTPEDDKQAADREKQALELWLQNWTFAEIARQVGYTHKSAASKAVKRALRAIPEVVAKPARQKISARCDWMQREVFAGRMQPDVAQAGLAIDKFRASLFGLNLEPPAANVQATQVVIQELPREMIEGV